MATDSLYYWKPNPGGQTTAWTSIKDILFVTGGNRSGKSNMLCHLAAANLLPHPNEPDYSYYPCLPDWDQLDPFDNPDTQELRRLRRVKLPSIVWFSGPSMAAHKDVAMAYFPDLLGDQIETVEWSDETGVWSRVIFKNGSQLFLKSAAQGLQGFQRANVDLILNDEPFDQFLYGEQLARLLDRKGRLVIGATAITSDTNPTAYRRSEWLIQTFAEPAKRNDLPPNVDVVSIRLTENPYIDKEYAKGIYSLLSDTERRARVEGEMVLFQGECYFNRDVLSTLKHKAVEPSVGMITEDLEWMENYNLGKGLTYRIWQQPELDGNYVIGVDPSGGHDDPSVCRVWRDSPRQLVAELRGWVPEDQLPRHLIRLCHYYANNLEVKRLTNVTVNIEVNSGRLPMASMQHGNTELGVVGALPRLYFRPKAGSLSKGVHYPSDVPGWHTLPSTRGFILSSAQDMIALAYNSDDAVMPDLDSLTEDYYWFVWEKGKPQAQRGKHDDRVFGDGLAWLAFKQRLWRSKSRPVEEVYEPQVFTFDQKGDLGLDLTTVLRGEVGKTKDVFYG